MSRRGLGHDDERIRHFTVAAGPQSQGLVVDLEAFGLSKVAAETLQLGTKGEAGMTFVFDNSYARLPSRFYARQSPAAVAGPRLVRLNQALAVELGLDPDWLRSPEGVAVLAGNAVPDGAEPLAMAYAGHQFGGFVPQLGDGRAILLGEVLDPGGVRLDIQLKGSGRTPFSRGGDGRAALGPVLREYIVSEAMHALGIPTTRALAAVTTGEPVYRETELPGAVLTRVARSHVRVGTFEYFAARQDTDAVRQLADYVIARHYPEAAADERPYRALLDAVIARQASLVAQWLGVGFIHGVMNTDNMSIAGETIDYGPCAFMDSYHPATVYSSIDRGGRYAYGNQPRIAQWNLSRLAESLLPLLDEDQDKAVEEAQAAIDAFPGAFRAGLSRPLSGQAGAAGGAPGRRRSHRRPAAGDGRARCGFHQQLPCPVRRGGRRGGRSPDGARRQSSRRSSGSAAGADVSRTRRRNRPRGRRRCGGPIPRSSPGITVSRRRSRRRSAAISIRSMICCEVLASPWEERPDSLPYRCPPEPHEVVRQTFCGT